MTSVPLNYAICRLTIAFVWLYHGLVPKLLYLHEDELAMSLAAGLSQTAAETLATLAGVAEIGMAFAVLFFWRQRWPLILTVVAMLGLLVFVAAFQPELLGGAFNPVTTNAALIALAIVGLNLQRSDQEES
ncbi:MAG: DoxX-like family protein [Pseudomonadales bacterium]|nr:DoxX-like family protein [Pseudomonadales bacterium]